MENFGGTSKTLRLKSNNNRNIKISNQKEEEIKRVKCQCNWSLLNIIVNSLILIFLIVLTFGVINNYKKKYEITFYLTFWSFFMNEFYIINAVILDCIRIFKNKFYNKSQKLIYYNNIIRDYYLRICFPFALSIVFLYWMLILLGDKFQYASRDLWDNCVSFSFHGLIFIFLLYDTFTYPHINKKRIKELNIKIFDCLIITITVGIYFLVLGISKYILKKNIYDFMKMTNKRQMAAAGFLIYMAILDGYIIFVLISNKYFIQEDENIKKESKIKNDENMPLKENISRENGMKVENGGKNSRTEDNNNIILNILKCQKSLKRKQLPPINIKKNNNNK